MGNTLFTFIAAPSCAGKTYHTRRALRGKSPKFLAAAGLAPSPARKDVDFMNVPLHAGLDPRIHLILYTLCTLPYFELGQQDYRDDALTEFLGTRHSLDLLTLVMPPHTLVKNVQRQRLSCCLRSVRPRNLLLLRRRLARLRKLEAVYADAAKVKSLYSAWFEFAAILPVREARIIGEWPWPAVPQSFSEASPKIAP